MLKRITVNQGAVNKRMYIAVETFDKMMFINFNL